MVFWNSFKKICEFELNRDNSRTLWRAVFDTERTQEELRTTLGRVYLITLQRDNEEEKIVKIGQSDDNSGARNIAGYGVGNGGSPSDRTTGIHYWIGNELYKNHKVSFYCIWTPEIRYSFPGFSNDDPEMEVVSSYSAKDLELAYLRNYEERFGNKPELNLQEDSRSWDQSIRDINRRLKSGTIEPQPDNIDEVDNYWKLYHWKYNGVNIF